MKKLIQILSVYTVSLFFLNFTLPDELSELGATSKDVQNRFWSAMQSEELSTPYLSSTVKSACRAISPENQAAAVKKVGGFLKAYYNSEDFQTRYSSWLAKSFSQGESKVSEQRKAEIHANRLKGVQGLTAKDMEPIVDIQIQSGETFAALEQMLPSLPAYQRAEMKKQIEDGKKNVAFYKKVKPLLKTDMEAFKKQYAEHLAEEEIAQSENQMAHNNKNLAAEHQRWADHKKVLTTRLTGFLEKSKGVDFNAQTREVNNRQKFVNPAYEAKNDIWKFCYRAGAIPTNTARAFAQQWLTELK